MKRLMSPLFPIIPCLLLAPTLKASDDIPIDVRYLDNTTHILDEHEIDQNGEYLGIIGTWRAGIAQDYWTQHNTLIRMEGDGSGISLGWSTTIIITGDNSNFVRVLSKRRVYGESRILDPFIRVYGTIKTTGANGHTIFIDSVSNYVKINNYGSIIATGDGAYAILSEASNTTLNLYSGSQIIGPIDLGGSNDNDTVNIYGDEGISPSLTLTFENTENINLNGLRGFMDGDTVRVIDTTSESSRVNTLYSLTTSIQNIASQRLYINKPERAIQLAALDPTPQMLETKPKNLWWGQIIGDKYNHEAKSESSAYDYSQLGLVLGYETDIKQNTLGLMGGYSSSRVETDTVSYSEETDNYFVGGYAIFSLGQYKLQPAIVGGYSRGEGNRYVFSNLYGPQNAKSDIDSVFISPSVSLSTEYQLDQYLKLRPLLRTSYSSAWVDDINETGTADSNISYEDRRIDVFDARIQLAAAYLFTETNELEFRVGLSSRDNENSSINGQLGNLSLNMDVDGERVTSRFFGAKLTVVEKQNLSLIIDIEHGGNNNESYTSGHASLEYDF